MAALIGIVGLAVCLFPAQQLAAAPTYPPRNGDPCSINLRQLGQVNLTASGQVIAGVAGKQTYICHIGIVSATAQNVALVEGTGAVCVTNTVGMAGGNTAATGWNLAANEFVIEGTGGQWITGTVATGDNVCVLLSSTGQTSGVIQYAQM